MQAILLVSNPNTIQLNCIDSISQIAPQIETQHSTFSFLLFYRNWVDFHSFTYGEQAAKTCP
jgi:hypothetical protein